MLNHEALQAYETEYSTFFTYTTIKHPPLKTVHENCICGGEITGFY